MNYPETVSRLKRCSPPHVDKSPVPDGYFHEHSSLNGSSQLCIKPYLTASNHHWYPTYINHNHPTCTYTAPTVFMGNDPSVSLSKDSSAYMCKDPSASMHNDHPAYLYDGIQPTLESMFCGNKQTSGVMHHSSTMVPDEDNSGSTYICDMTIRAAVREAPKPPAYPLCITKPPTYPLCTSNPPTYPLCTTKPPTYPLCTSNPTTYPLCTSKPVNYPLCTTKPPICPPCTSLPMCKTIGVSPAIGLTQEYLKYDYAVPNVTPKEQWAYPPQTTHGLSDVYDHCHPPSKYPPSFTPYDQVIPPEWWNERTFVASTGNQIRNRQPNHCRDKPYVKPHLANLEHSENQIMPDNYYGNQIMPDNYDGNQIMPDNYDGNQIMPDNYDGNLRKNSSRQRRGDSTQKDCPKKGRARKSSKKKFENSLRAKFAESPDAQLSNNCAITQTSVPSTSIHDVISIQRKDYPEFTDRASFSRLDITDGKCINSKEMLTISEIMSVLSDIVPREDQNEFFSQITTSPESTGTTPADICASACDPSASAMVAPSVEMGMPVEGVSVGVSVEEMERCTFCGKGFPCPLTLARHIVELHTIDSFL